MTDIKKPKRLDKKQKLIIIAGIAGIALILLSGLFTTTKREVPAESDSQFDIEEYRITLESRLADIISHIQGAGNTGVMITLDGGREYLYAKNTAVEESSDSSSLRRSEENEYYTVKDTSNGENPVIIRESEPQVRGVIVVCEGADDSAVKAAITHAVSSIFNIAENKISVNKIAN